MHESGTRFGGGRDLWRGTSYKGASVGNGWILEDLKGGNQGKRGSTQNQRGAAARGGGGGVFRSGIKIRVSRVGGWDGVPGQGIRESVLSRRKTVCVQAQRTKNSGKTVVFGEGVDAAGPLLGQAL